MHKVVRLRHVQQETGTGQKSGSRDLRIVFERLPNFLLESFGRVPLGLCNQFSR
jgi:hypothetical protein